MSIVFSREPDKSKIYIKKTLQYQQRCFSYPLKTNQGTCKHERTSKDQG